MLIEIRDLVICIIISFLLTGSSISAVPIPSEPDEPLKIGLVLSGGGAKGFAHVGVLKIIDSLHIPIDFIVGTSMGSIIGGLYAMGYSGNEIEALIREQDWGYILTDKISRKYIPLSIRDEYDRYILSFPIRSRIGTILPKGLIQGQNIINLFCQLSYNHYGIDKIEELPVKFACIATDIVSGKEVVIDSGNIAEAMRASMSIPYVFTPVESGDLLLVDGGMRNNFPADVIKKMGADIVIGVDVQRGMKNKKEAIRSGNDMIDQAIYFLGEEAYARSIGCVDIYIKPDIEKYGVMDFNQSDSLIVKGLNAARKNIGQLAALQEKMGRSRLFGYSEEYLKKRFVIREVKFSGLDRTPAERMKRRVTFRYPGYVSLKNIRETVDCIYGTLGFETVYYRLEGPQQDTLNFIVKEKLMNTFNIGFHYDTWENASLLLNTTFASGMARNGSRFSFNLKLSQYPRFLGSYLLDNGARPGLRIGADVSRIQFYDYHAGRKENSFTTAVAYFNASVMSIIKDSYTVGIGAGMQYYNCDVNSHINQIKRREEDILWNYFIYVRVDTREKANYARSGIKMTAQFQKITDNGLTFKDNNSLYSGYFEIVKPLNYGKLTLIPQFYMSGFLSGKDEVPFVSHVSVGGPVIIDDAVHRVPFIGLRPFELLRSGAIALRCDLQWEMFRRNYLIAKVNLLKTDDFIDWRGYQWGVGLAYSYESVIGPMETMAYWSEINQRFGGFISVGYRF